MSNQSPPVAQVRFSGVSWGDEGDKPPPPPHEPNVETSPGKPSLRSKALRGALMRSHPNRDPLFYYEIVSVLGVGSMGSVAKVKTRAAVAGGSARPDVQKHFRKEKRLKACFELPLVGGMFQFCLKGGLEFRSDQSMSSSEHYTDSVRSTGSSIIGGGAKDALLETYNDGHGNEDPEVCFAMKSIHLSRVSDPTFIDEIRNEVKILKELDHPHIVKAMETFEHRNQIFIVMELCWGGDLYSRDPYTEDESARIVSSILSAICYMHENGIIHRDLKYENILFVDSSPKAQIKLIDFGLSATFGQDKLTEGVGTIYTMAPEVLKGEYSKQADLWSVGVIAFMLVSSQMPFYGRKRSHIVEQIMLGKFQFKGRRWKRLSSQAKEFIKDLLVVDPDERYTADEALSAAWLNRRFGATARNPQQEELDSAHQSMLNYASYSKLKKVALMVIAHKSTSAEIGILRKIFQKYDANGSGALDYDEFKRAAKDAGLPLEDTKEIFEALDLDGTGKIRYTEFIASTLEMHGSICERRLAEAFDRIDSDDSGYITVENLREMLGEEIPEAEIEEIIKESDITKDGQISYHEFLAQWEDRNEAKRLSLLNDVSLTHESHIRASQVNVPFEYESDGEGDGEPANPVARANFLEGKQHSERRAAESSKGQTGTETRNNGVRTADI